MTRIVLKPDLAAVLQQQPSEVQLCDESGRTLGYFLPGSLSGYINSECPYPPEELAEAAKQTTGRPLADILRDLREKS